LHQRQVIAEAIYGSIVGGAHAHQDVGIGYR
jgi:hypothetical protein